MVGAIGGPRRGWRLRRRWGRAMAAAGLMLLGGGQIAHAGPRGAQVQHGNVTITQQSPTTTVIEASNNAIINYQNFDIGLGETVRFVQPSATSRVLNRVMDGQITRIDGSLLSNGHVYLVNSSGIYFGGSAVVNVGAITAAAGSITNEDFLAGIDRFTDIRGEVVNQGEIRGSAIHLIGSHVLNTGTLHAPDGVITLTAGNDVYLTDRYSKVMVKVEGGTAGGKGVENRGVIDAGAGQVALGAGDVYATAISQSATGLMRGQDVRLAGGANGGRVEVSGVIDASNANGRGGTVQVLGREVALYDARIDASGALGGGRVLIGGDYQGRGDTPTAYNTFVSRGTTIAADALTLGDGGTVIVWADHFTAFQGTITARGGAAGGNGGFAEVSGHAALRYAGLVDLSAPGGGKTGTLLLDPDDIVIEGGAGVSDDLADADDFDDMDGSTLTITEKAIEDAMADVILQAQDSITVSGVFGEDTNGEGAGAIVRLKDGLNLVMDTRNAAGEGSGGVNLTGVAVEFQTQGTGGITIRAGVTGTDAGGDAGTANVTVGALSTLGTGSITLEAEGNVVVNGAVATADVAPAASVGADDATSGSITINAGGVLTGTGSLTTGSATVDGDLGGGVDTAASGSITITTAGAGVNAIDGAITIGDATVINDDGDDVAASGEIRIIATGGDIGTALGDRQAVAIGQASGGTTNNTGTLRLTATGSDIFITSAENLIVSQIDTAAGADAVAISTIGAANLTLNGVNGYTNLGGDTIDLDSAAGTINISTTTLSANVITIDSVSGPVTLNAPVAAADNLTITTGGSISLGSTLQVQDATLTSNVILFPANPNSIAGDGTGTLTFQPSTRDLPVGIGVNLGLKNNTRFDITQADLNTIQQDNATSANFAGIIIGRTDSQGTMTIGSAEAITFRDPAILRMGGASGSIVLSTPNRASAGLNGAANASLTLIAGTGGQVSLNGGISTVGTDVTIRNLAGNNNLAVQTNLNHVTNAGDLITTGVGAGTVQIAGAIDSGASLSTLRVTAGTGNVVLTGAVGVGNELSQLILSGANVTLHNVGTMAAQGVVGPGTGTEQPLFVTATGMITFTGTIYNSAGHHYVAPAGDTFRMTAGAPTAILSGEQNVLFDTGRIKLAAATDLLVDSAGGTVSIPGGIDGTTNEDVALVSTGGMGFAPNAVVVGRIGVGGGITEVSLEAGNRVRLQGNITTANFANNFVFISGPAEIGANVTINTSHGASNNGPIVFDSTIESVTANQFTLTTNSGLANTEFDGAVGVLRPLAGLTATTTSPGTIIISGGRVRVADNADQTYNGNVVLSFGTGTAAMTNQFDGRNVRFNGTITRNATGAPQSILVNASGVTRFGGQIGAVTPFHQVTTDAAGTTEIGDRITTNMLGMTFNDPVTLVGTPAITTLTSSGSGGITFGSTLNADGVNVGSLTLELSGGGSVSFNGAVGETVRLGAVRINAASMNVANVTAASSFRAASFQQSNGTGNTSFAGAFSTTDTTIGVAITNSGQVTFGSTITTNGGPVSITAGAAVNVTGPVNTAGIPTTPGGAVTVSTAGSISFGNLDTRGGPDLGNTGGKNGGAVALTSTAGSVTVGSIITSGADASAMSPIGSTGGNAGNITLQPDSGTNQGAAGPGDNRPDGILTLNGDITGIGGTGNLGPSGLDAAVNLAPAGRMQIPTVATIVGPNIPNNGAGGNLTITARDLTMGQHEKLTVVGNFTFTDPTVARGSNLGIATLGDINTFGTTRITAGNAIRLRDRNGGNVLNLTGALDHDAGLDMIAGGNGVHNFNLAPVLLNGGMGDTTFANTDGLGDVNGNIGFLYRTFGPITRGFFSLGPIVLDIRAQGISNINVADAVASFSATPVQSGNVFTDTLAGASQQSFLAEMGIVPRDLTAIETFWMLSGRATYNDIPSNPDLTPTDQVEVALTRLQYDAVADLLDTYRTLLYSQATDTTGQSRLISRRAEHQQTLQSAHDRFLAATERKSFDPAAFRLYVETTPSEQRTLVVLNGLRTMLRQIEQTGLTRPDAMIAWRKIVAQVNPPSLSVQQLADAALASTLAATE